MPASQATHGCMMGGRLVLSQWLYSGACRMSAESFDAPKVWTTSEQPGVPHIAADVMDLPSCKRNGHGRSATEARGAAERGDGYSRLSVGEDRR
jgi:hypothetical protein